MYVGLRMPKSIQTSKNVLKLSLMACLSARPPTRLSACLPAITHTGIRRMGPVFITSNIIGIYYTDLFK